VIKLIDNGKMTKTGLSKIDVYLKTGKVDWKKEMQSGGKIKKPDVPDYIVMEFSKNEPALQNFNKLATSNKQHYILWITNAKKKETKLNRLKESVVLLKANKKLGLK